MIKFADPADVVIAYEMSTGTAYMPRDILMAMYTGNLYQIFFGDGSSALPWKTVTAQVQTLLDSITTTVGSILFRTSTGWAGLAPGTSGQVLTTYGPSVLPAWAAASGGGSSVPSLMAQPFGYGANQASESDAFAGIAIVPWADFNITAIWQMIDTTATDTYTAYVLALSASTGSSTIESVTQSDTFTEATTTTKRYLRHAFSSPVALAAGTAYGIMAGCNSLGNTGPIKVYYASDSTPQLAIPASVPSIALLAQATPTVGDSITLSAASTTAWLMALEFQPPTS